MMTVNAMTDTDNKMTSLALHGVTAPSQTSRAVGGLAGANEESGSLTPMLKPVSGLSDFLAEYIDSKNKFENELRTVLREAREAASSMEAEKRVENQHKSETKETARATSEPKAETQSVLESVDTVENFAGRYNNLTQFLQENQEVSERTASLSSALNDASRSVGTFSAIGVTADANGKLHVNAARLAESLKNRPESVEYALGRDGLAGRAQKGIDLAEHNKDRLFPSISSAMGREDNPAKSMYSPKAVAARNDFTSKGSMLNMMS